MPDYQKGKIYCIRSHQTDKVYVGSTVQKHLCMRMAGHKRDFKNYKNGKYNYVSSFDILEYDDAYIELIEDFPCENKNQLERREGHFIREMDCVNKFIAGRTCKEYREDNKDKFKEWCEANKDKIKQRMKEYKEANKDKIRQQKKKYDEANRDKQNQQQRERRLKKKQESNSI